MSKARRAIAQVARMVWLVALGALVVAGLSVLYLLPDLVRFLPLWITNEPIEWIALLLLSGYGVAWVLAIGPRSARGNVHLAGMLDRTDAVCGAILTRWLLVGFAGIATLWLLTWLPHYPYWPWCRDVDSYAEMAQEWDSGVLPYRDIRAFNFPGHIYVHWILGKLFGWGHTGLFYALDAVVLLVLGAVVIAWSRRCLGLALPGTAAYFIFLSYYLGLDFQSVAERDWHSPLCAVLGMLLLQAWPSRRSRWLSAILAAVAFTIRPNVVLFFPALLAAATSGDVAWRGALPADVIPLAARRRIIMALECICVFSIVTLLLFAPLLLSGLMGDFARGLAILKPGGPYSNATTARSVKILWEELSQFRTWALLVSLVSLAFASRDRAAKSMARTWLLALAAALVYRPIHPQDHAYLRTPMSLVVAVAWAIPIAWVIRNVADDKRVRFSRFPALLAILLVVYEAMPAPYPHHCNLRSSIDSIRAALRGGWPEVPPGAWSWYNPGRGRYSWDAYCRLLRYVRETTGPETIVANALRCPPFPGLNGTTGRLSPFRVESGVAWMWVVAEDLDQVFAEQVEGLGPDSIVVWSPSDADGQFHLELNRLTAVITDHYAPEARFDRLQVWRRKKAVSTKPVEK
jgi:hypothetical protein